MTMIVPLKTPPNMLQPPDPVVIKGALKGLETLTLEQIGERLSAMPDESKALTLIEEIDHLIWLASIWLHCEKLLVSVEYDSSPPSESEARWTKAPLEKIQWCLIDRYRTAGLDAEVRAWLETNAVPF